MTTLPHYVVINNLIPILYIIIWVSITIMVIIMQVIRLTAIYPAIAVKKLKFKVLRFDE